VVTEYMTDYYIISGIRWTYFFFVFTFFCSPWNGIWYLKPTHIHRATSEVMDLESIVDQVWEKTLAFAEREADIFF
jgi:hypothetical protein